MIPAVGRRYKKGTRLELLNQIPRRALAAFGSGEKMEQLALKPVVHHTIRDAVANAMRQGAGMTCCPLDRNNGIRMMRRNNDPSRRVSARGKSSRRPGKPQQMSQQELQRGTRQIGGVQ